MFLALTGKRLESADVYHTGIATHFIEPDELRRFEQDTCTWLCQFLRETPDPIARWTLGAEEKTSISNFAKSFSTYCKEIDEVWPTSLCACRVALHIVVALLIFVFCFDIFHVSVCWMLNRFQTVPSAIGKYSKYINRNFNKTTLEDIFEVPTTI